MVRAYLAWASHASRLAAFRPAMRPHTMFSALFPPEMPYVWPAMLPKHPAAYRRGMGWSLQSTTFASVFFFGPPSVEQPPGYRGQA